jgi:hypothetical protein
MDETHIQNYCSEPLLQIAEVPGSILSSEDGYTDWSIYIFPQFFNEVLG